MKEIKLIAFDLDGTLLKDNKEISDRNIAALTAAAKRGIILVPTTGRLYRRIPEELRQLPFIRYMIAANGAAVYDKTEENVLHREDLTVEEAGQVLEYAADLPTAASCYQNGRGWISKNGMRQLKEYLDDPPLYAMMQSIFTPVESLEEFLSASNLPVQKMILVFGDMEVRAAVLQRMPEDFPNLAISSSAPFNIEINTKAATKGAALRFLCEYLGISQEQIAAFGDSSNDIFMLQNAGIGIAMGNAAREVQEIADQVTDSNENDGVAKWIEQYLA